MKQDHTYLIVDAGNTQVKLVYFQNGEIVSHDRLNADDVKKLEDHLKKNSYDKAILSSVQSDIDTRHLFDLIQPDVVLSKSTDLPIDLSSYETVNTLGADRIANAVAAAEFSQTENALVVDIGTCIKYDLVVSDQYQGGGISPGMEMRFKALHDYTGQLPLLEYEDEVPLIGKSTKGSMLSGVINGMINEISAVSAEYEREFSPLTIFLTGGDAKRFDKALKNSIFADEKLTVKGLYLILKHNG
tara:strand:+ start:112791 stop:113522 length:732 start_codon:yes stop_codon:yes gene_type:complete